MLAVHTAHLLAPYFPDAQLFIDLRGLTSVEKIIEAGPRHLAQETISGGLLDRNPRL